MKRTRFVVPVTLLGILGIALLPLTGTAYADDLPGVVAESTASRAVSAQLPGVTLSAQIVRREAHQGKVLTPNPSAVAEPSQARKVVKTEALNTGEPIFIDVILNNKSAQTVGLGGSAFDVSSFKFFMKDAKGQPVPLTRYGREILTPPTVVFGNGTVEIAAGASRRYRFPLDRMFDLSESGVHFLTIKRRIITSYRANENPKYTTTELMVDDLPVHLAGDSQSVLQQVKAQRVGAKQRQYAFIVNRQGRKSESGGIARYLIGADGRLSPLSQSWVSAGKGSRSIAVSPDNRFAYVANGGDDTLSQFHITEDGGLMPLNPPTVPTGKSPVVVRISPDGKYVYALGYGGVAGYRVTQDGALVQLSTDIPLPIPTDRFSFHPNGRFAYGVSGSVFLYRVRPDGGMEPPSPQIVAGMGQSTVAITPDGQHAYLMGSRHLPREEGKPNRYLDVILSFRISPDGSLTRLDGESRPQAPPPAESLKSLDTKGEAGQKPPVVDEVYFGIQKLVIDPSGRYLYALNDVQGLTATFEIAANGVLVPVGFPARSRATSPTAMSFDATGGYAYSANGHNNYISQFQIGERGTLGTLGLTAYNIGSESEDIAVVTTPMATQAGAVSAGLQVEAHLEQDTYNPDDPIVLTISLKNTTSRALPIGTRSGELSRLAVSIKDEKGVEVPLRRYGERIFAGSASRKMQNAATVKNDSLILPGGVERQYRFLLNRTHDITRYGTYQLEVQWQRVGVTVVSNLLRWQLDDPFTNGDMGYAATLNGDFRYYDGNGIGLPGWRQKPSEVF